MKKTLKLIIGIGNIFLSVFVTLKVYGYFAPHTGLNLPDLTYLQVFAIQLVLSIFFMNVTREIRIQEIHEHLLGAENNGVFTKLGVILFLWFVMYIISVTVF
jgi:hypothetical protein